jgi:hypothetical protein
VDSEVVDWVAAVKEAAATGEAARACEHTQTKYGTRSAAGVMPENMLKAGMKRCQGCRWLSVDCFDTNPTTNELYSKCMDCKLKPSATGHAKRDADRKRQKAALEAGETPETLICVRCGPQPFAAFGINADTGLPHDNCEPCHVKALGAKAAYKQTDAGKEANKRYDESEKGKEANKRYSESEKGKERDKRYSESEKGKERDKRYDGSEKGKATDKRYREGDAGQEAAKRFADNRQDRRRASTAMRMDATILCAANKLISGLQMTSPTFIARTGFASEAAFLSAVEATFQPGMTFANNGTVWQLDHKIPREAYDFDNSEDVRRCWSPKNVHALTKAANLEKSWKLIDQYIVESGIENFPTAWNGKFPDADFKNTHTAKMMARKILEDEAAEEEQPSSSNGAMEEAPDSDSE